MKSYAVLCAPEFRLQATLRYHPHLSGQPVALLDSEGRKPLVCEMTAEAAAARVETGLTPTQAKARCPDLHLLSGNRGHERAAENAMLQTAETLSPFLETTAPGVVTIEWPMEKGFDATEMVALLVEPLGRIGLKVRLGVAATPFLAHLAARLAEPVRKIDDARSFLAPLPIEVLQVSEEARGVLHGWGIRTVGRLVTLPLPEVCERLGPEAVRLWERAAGDRPRPLKLIKAQEFFSEQADLENPVEMLEPLLFLLRRFLEQITVRLAHVYLVAGKLRLVLRFETGLPYQRIFTIPHPTRDAGILFRMLHTHLENFTSESPIIGLELAAKPVRPGAEQSGLLEKSLRDPHQLGETLARLEAVLGPGQVGTAELEPSQHPDAYHLRAYDANAETPAASDEPLIGVPWFRFQPPVAAQVILNGVHPAYLYSSRITGPVKESCGPWVMEGNWWESRHWFREEWDALTEEGIYRLVRIGEEWFLDGVYG